MEKATIFTISKDQKSIVLDGVVNSSAFEKFKALSKSYPQAKTMEIGNYTCIALYVKRILIAIPA